MENLVDFIRPDCSIVLLDGQILTPEKIKDCKKYYKKEIFEKLGGQTVGKVALIWTNNLDVILPSFLALWELGVAVSVHDFNAKVVSHPMFQNFYSHIDLVIGPDGNDTDINLVLTQIPHVKQISNSLLFELSEHDKNLEIYPNEKITGETLCCVTHTSGTTGEPKIIKTTHRTAIDLVKENIKIFEFSSQDKVMHHKTLHHGSLFLNYAIPAFCSTNQHFWVSNDLAVTKEDQLLFLQNCIDKCQREKITKWLLPGLLIGDLPNNLIAPADLESTSLITVIGPEPRAMQKIFEKFNPKSVYNNFGCTEIGTLAVSKTEKNTVNDYEPNKFTIFNSLVDLEIHDSYFKCKFKNHTQWQTIGDIVELKGQVFYWHGRNNKLKFGQQEVLLSDLNQWFKDRLKSIYFSLVADFDLNCLYLAIFDKSLNHVTIESINHEFKQTDQFKDCFLTKLDFIDFKEVVMGIKPSQPVLLWYFRGLKT